MNYIYNYFDSFKDNPRINPKSWDKKTFSFNIIYIICEFILLTVLVYLLLFLIPTQFGIDGYKFYIAIITAGIRGYQQVQTLTSFIIIPQGFNALGKIQGEVQGEYTGTRYHLREGKYRGIVDMIFYNDIFEATLFPIEQPNKDVDFFNVTTKDGYRLIGTKTIRKNMVNPWKWTDLLLATNDSINSMESLHKIADEKIIDVALEAINNAADNLTLKHIMDSGNDKDGTERFITEYREELSKIGRLSRKQTCFIAGGQQDCIDEFYFDEVGLNVAISIKTIIPMSEEVIKALETRVVAEATKLKIKLEGEGTAAAEQALAKAAAEEYKRAYEDFVGMHGMDPKTAAQKAALSANLYAHETINEIGNSDGTPIQGGGLDLTKVMVLAKSLFQEISKK